MQKSSTPNQQVVKDTIYEYRKINFGASAAKGSPPGASSHFVAKEPGIQCQILRNQEF
jgi:hypothetical protein